MNYGFIKVAAATPSVAVADCVSNTTQIIKLIDQAEHQQVKVLVFPELCITSYTCGDLFFQSALHQQVAQSLQHLIAHSQNVSMLIIVGAPLQQQQKLYNCSIVIHDGRILGVIPKTYLPNYMEFQEVRYFSSAPSCNSTIQIGNHLYPFGSKLIFRHRHLSDFSVAIELCEDLWSLSPPSISHALAGATIIGNLSASNEVIGKQDYRRQLVVGQSGRLLCGYIYASAGQGESSTDLVFSGHNLIAENGQLLKESIFLEDELIVSEIDVNLLAEERCRRNTFVPHTTDYTEILFDMSCENTPLTRLYSAHPFIPLSSAERSERCKQILQLQAIGLKKRLQHTGVDTIIIGLSGGLDSSLALLATVEAIDLLQRSRTDIIAITMPCFGTTSRTRENAEQLAQCLGVTFLEIPITKVVQQHFLDIEHSEQQQDTTYENAQARERTQVLMDMANKMNGLVVGTGDLSELALGFTTYNGDHMSMYGLNCSIPKTLVRHLIDDIAHRTSMNTVKQILLDILETPVSPELLPNQQDHIKQKTEEIIGPYELHDFFLYYMIRFGFTPKKIFHLAQYSFQNQYHPSTILQWLQLFYRRFFSQQFKRSCMPDGVKIGSVTLSPRGDFRMPSDAVSSIWLRQLEELDEESIAFPVS